MTRFLFHLSLFVAISVILRADVVSAKETPVSESSLPPAVRSSFRAAYPKATITGCTKEKVRGTWTYEIKCDDGGARKDVAFSENGTITEVEEHIAPQQLPQPVMQSMVAESHKWKKGHADFVDMEKRTVGKELTFEISVHVGKKLKTYRFKPDGTLIK